MTTAQEVAQPASVVQGAAESGGPLEAVQAEVATALAQQTSGAVVTQAPPLPSLTYSAPTSRARQRLNVSQKLSHLVLHAAHL